ncbi:MAG: LPS assembly lipoprotein LptE [Pseudomonadota bacterium]
MRKIYAAFALAVAAGLPVAGCGFQPVYAPALSAAASPIQIEQIDGRAGHELRKALLQETANGLPGAPQGGVLTVSLRETLINTGFRSDGSTSRSRLRLTADYVIDLGDDAKSGRERVEIAVNVPDEIFQDISNQTNAREDAARALARQITNQLILDLTDTG